MKNRITLHIGSHKAGSTAIQEVCRREGDLLAASGVLYPIGLFRRYPAQHSELAELLKTGEAEALARFAERIHAMSETESLPHVFLSGEDLCSAIERPEIDRLASALRGRFDEVAVVLVLRRKADYLLSHFNHFLRHGVSPVGALEFREAVRFSPRRTVDDWTGAFGQDAVRVLAYDAPPPAPSMLQRFFDAALNVTLPEAVVAAKTRVNASFDLMSAALVNEVLKPLPVFDLTDVNAAYLGAFQVSRGRMPVFERDFAAFLDGLFPDSDWELEELPGLCERPAARPPLDAEAAARSLDALAEFLASLRTLYVHPGDGPARPGDIVSAYRAFLGRSPSAEEVGRVVRARKSMTDLRQMFADSPEFRRKHRERLNVAPLNLPPLDVTVEATEAQQERMFAHLSGRWARLGREKAHWSVWSEPEFSGAVTPELDDAFYRTGEEELRALEATLSRAGHAPPDFKRLVDFGCGMGRFTLNAARRFPDVVGIDFSPSHLEAARAAAERRGIATVRWTLKEGLAPVETGPYDLWYSRLVLQHNPPSLIGRFLRDGLAGLSAGGIAVFQVPTYALNYSFNPSRYLDDLAASPEIEMHCLPQPGLLRLLDEMSCRVLEIREDNAVDIPRYWVSNTVVVRKTA